MHLIRLYTLLGTGTLLAQVGDKLLTVVGCDLMGAVAYKDWAQTVNAVEKG